jgi:hypothetical protein
MNIDMFVSHSVSDAHRAHRRRRRRKEATRPSQDAGQALEAQAHRRIRTEVSVKHVNETETAIAQMTASNVSTVSVDTVMLEKNMDSSIS